MGRRHWHLSEQGHTIGLISRPGSSERREENGLRALVSVAARLPPIFADAWWATEHGMQVYASDPSKANAHRLAQALQILNEQLARSEAVSRWRGRTFAAQKQGH